MPLSYSRWYLDSDWTQYVDFKVPEFGNEDNIDFNQAWGKTEGGEVFVEDPEFITQVLHLNFMNIKDTQRYNFQYFFENTLLRGQNKVSVMFSAFYPQRMRRVVHCDMTIVQPDGTEEELLCDHQYPTGGDYIYCDQLLPPKEIYLIGYRIMNGSLAWKDAQDGYWDLSLTLSKNIIGWEHR